MNTRHPLLGLLILALSCATAAAQPALALLEKTIAFKHPVPQLSADSLAHLIRNGAEPLLFDVRRPDEYALSRIRGAIRVDPDLSAADFATAFGDTVGGRDLVFYCSVGYRSSILLERVRDAALAGNARSLANLRGGIFRWYNERRPLHDAGGRVDTVHRYDAFWGRLLKKR